MIQQIDIQNLRGIKHACIKKIGHINLLYGLNNCGKTTILDALFLVSGMSNPTLSLNINILRSYQRIDENDLLLNFYKAQSDNHIKIKSIGEHSRHLDISRFVYSPDKVSLSELAKGNVNDVYKYGLRSVFSIDGGEEYVSEFRIEKNKEGKGSGHINADEHYSETLFCKYLNSMLMNNPLIDEYSFVIKTKREQSIIDALKFMEPHLEDIQIVGKQLMVDVGCEQRLPINVLGDGIKKFLYILVSMQSCENGIMLIDEVDNGLHHTALTKLWTAILSEAKRLNVQLFLTTHSWDMLTSLNEVLLSNNAIDKEDIVVHKLIKKEDDEVISLPYGGDQINYIVNQDIEIR